MLSEMLVGDRRVTVCGPGVSIFVDILVESTNTVFVNSINMSTNIEMTVQCCLPSTPLCHKGSYSWWERYAGFLIHTVPQ